MKISKKPVQDVQILVLSGRFDSESAPEVQRQLQTTFARDGSRIICNMADVDFVDSTALSTLVQARRQASEGQGDLYLCHLQQPARIIFELTRLDKVFDIFPDEQAALLAFMEDNLH